MKLKDIQILNEKETRAGFGEGIHELAKENENVLVLKDIREISNYL